jgi:hypothetical protein
VEREHLVQLDRFDLGHRGDAVQIEPSFVHGHDRVGERRLRVVLPVGQELDRASPKGRKPVRIARGLREREVRELERRLEISRPRAARDPCV